MTLVHLKSFEEESYTEINKIEYLDRREAVKISDREFNKVLRLIDKFNLTLLKGKKYNVSLSFDDTRIEIEDSEYKDRFIREDSLPFFSIDKTDDNWFYIIITQFYENTIYYKCDTISGVVKFFKDNLVK